jgi:integrase
MPYFTWRLLCRDGVFYADGRSANQNLGKHSLGTRDRAEALTLLRQLDRKKAYDLGLTKSKEEPSPALQLSIDSGWDQYLAFAGRPAVMGGVAPGTLKRYRSVRRFHTEYCQKHGITDWNSFGKAELEDLGREAHKTYAYRGVYFTLTLVKSVNAWLINEKLLAPELRLRYSLSKPQGTDTYCYRPDEVAAMVQHCQERSELIWLGNVIVALAHTGMRIGELAGLRWSDVDLSAQIIHVADERASQRKHRAGTARTTKGRRSRAIPIHPRLFDLLRQLERKPDGRVFHAPRGGRLRPRNVLTLFIRDVIEPLKERFPVADGDIGFEHGRLHSFRHFFCSQALLSGATLSDVKDWLGHADSKMVEHYRHLRDQDAVRRMEQVEFLPAEEGRRSQAEGNQQTPATVRNDSRKNTSESR